MKSASSRTMSWTLVQRTLESGENIRLNKQRNGRARNLKSEPKWAPPFPQSTLVSCFPALCQSLLRNTNVQHVRLIGQRILQEGKEQVQPEVGRKAALLVADLEASRWPQGDEAHPQTGEKGYVYSKDYHIFLSLRDDIPSRTPSHPD